MKRRHTRTPGTQRYSRIDSRGERFPVRERDVQLLVNLQDYLDTGLHSDHRDTRCLLRDCAQGRDFLNLFAYTGAFTCSAAAGGAESTLTVDKSATYLDWARDNMALNGFTGREHRYVQSDTGVFLERARRERRRFTLAVVDPPSFFTYGKKKINLDINRDHLMLIQDVLSIMAPGSTVFFSTNHQRFEPKLDGLRVNRIVELTPSTIPEDYRNRRIHRCWEIHV